MLARNCGFAVRLGVATTGVPDFLTAMRFLGCAVFFKTSSRLSASTRSELSDFSGVREPEPFSAAAVERPWLSDVGKVPPVSGNLGEGAEITGSALVGCAFFADAPVSLGAGEAGADDEAETVP